MSGETTATIIGNLVSDPELKFTQSGAAVASFTIASTPRTFDKTTNEWKDGDALFLRCSIWRQAAENAAESLVKGMRVIASGVLKQRSYEKDGQKRTVVELDVEEVGPSLKYATAKVAKAERSGGNGQSSAGQSQNRGQSQSGPQSGPQSGWGDSGNGAQGGWPGSADNPPF